MRKLNYTLYKAMQAYYEGERTKALYQLDLAFQNPVAIGDDSVVLLKQLSEAEEALERLEKNFGDFNDKD